MSDTENVLPEGYVIAPHFRGYALLGVGQYLLNHTAPHDPAELVLSIATEAEKAGRVVGDTRDNIPGALIQPEVIAVRIGFDNVAGLDALEQQLRFLREYHFPETVPLLPPVAAPEPTGWRDFIVQLSHAEGGMLNGNRISAAAKALLASQPAQGERQPCAWRVKTLDKVFLTDKQR